MKKSYLISSFSGFLTADSEENAGSSEEEENCGIMMMGTTPADEREAQKICT